MTLERLERWCILGCILLITLLLCLYYRTDKALDQRLRTLENPTYGHITITSTSLEVRVP